MGQQDLGVLVDDLTRIRIQWYSRLTKQLVLLSLTTENYSPTATNGESQDRTSAGDTVGLKRLTTDD
jgi:hypothetical protein